MSKKGNGFALDDDVKKEVKESGSEQDLLGSWVTDGSGGDKLPLIENWIPDGDQWQGKTVVNENEARLFAIARNLPKAYDEISHMQPFIDGLFTDLEMYKTSVDGLSREQQKSVFMAMFGATDDGSTAGNVLMNALAGQGDDDD